MQNVYGVYGVGGFGREVMPIVQRQVLAAHGGKDSLYFVDDADVGESVNGFPVVDFDSFCKLPAEEHLISIAISGGEVREQVAVKCQQAGVKMVGVRAENSVMLSEIEIGPGEILCPFVTLTSNIRIGKSFHANLYSYVAHDCVIGDYVTFAPGVCCNGNVVIEDRVYMGTGAIVKQGQPGRPIIIGKGAVVAAGAFVTRNVPEGMTVFGNPAIEMTRENLRKRNG